MLQLPCIFRSRTRGSLDPISQQVQLDKAVKKQGETLLPLKHAPTFPLDNEPEGLNPSVMSRCIELLPFSICLLDFEGSILFCNASFTRNITVKSLGSATSIKSILAPSELSRIISSLKRLKSFGVSKAEDVSRISILSRKLSERFDWTLTRIECSSLRSGGYVVASVAPSALDLTNCETSTSFTNRMLAPPQGHIVDGEVTEVSPSPGGTPTYAAYRKRLHSERRRTCKLEKTLETKSLFVRYISHEIRTPLNVVLSGLNLYKDIASLDSESASLIDDIRFSCLVAIDILNDFLLYEKMEGDALQLDKTLANTTQIIKGVFDQFQVQARHSQLNFELVGDLSQAVHASVDPQKIAQVIRNLVSNALKFSPRQGKVSMVVKILDETKRVRLEVHDEGPGISKENQARLFKEIVQFHAAEQQKGQGSGMGLFISKQLVSMHGGDLGMESDGEGLGAMFFLELPFESTSTDLSVAGTAEQIST